VSSAYGAGGAFVVAFPGTPGPECPGPNYIVQDYAVDWAIVQTQKWNTLYVLSRERTPSAASIEVSSPGRWRVERVERLADRL
jgi:apolipoprotein D and lipocalin family protein